MTYILTEVQGLWLVQDTFMLPNLQTKPNDRMLVTRLQPGPFSGCVSDAPALQPSSGCALSLLLASKESLPQPSQAPITDRKPTALQRKDHRQRCCDRAWDD